MPAYEPTPEEIREVCLEIQSEWSEVERLNRGGTGRRHHDKYGAVSGRGASMDSERRRAFESAVAAAGRGMVDRSTTED